MTQFSFIKSSLRALSFAAVAGMIFFALPYTVSAEPVEVIVVEGRGVEKVTRVGDIPSQAGEKAPAVAPFTTSREMKPAGSAMIGDKYSTSDQPNIDVVNYAVSVANREPGKNLVLNCTISQPEDEMTLSRLANRIYHENNGRSYDNVTIFWHIGSNPEPAQPWARTDVDKVSESFSIVRM